MAKIAS